MAHYTTTVTKTATAQVPYHFICNYCGKRNDKLQEVTGEASITQRGMYTDAASTGLERNLDLEAKDNLSQKIKSIDEAIKDYGDGLRQGRTFSYSFMISELQGEHPDHLKLDMVSDATCAHCGKKQAWSIDPAEAAILPGCFAAAVGLPLTIVITLLAFKISDSLGIAAALVLLIGYIASMYLLPKRTIRINQAKIAAEPNDPDKLPVFDSAGNFTLQY